MRIGYPPNQRLHLQLTLLSTDDLSDSQASLAFLEALAQADAERIALIGPSFGGQLTELEAELVSAVEPRVCDA